MRDVVITFDAGQTLIELDPEYLASRLVHRGLHVSGHALKQAAPSAWLTYDRLVDDNVDHATAWRGLMTALLHGAGVTDPEPHAAWLFEENPGKNLWRKPIPEMIELAGELGELGYRVGVLSNSEGRLAELLTEIGIIDRFAAVIDSGRIGLEKPDRKIFDHALAVLGAGPGGSAIHIGDSWNADIVGARDAGWRTIWYGRRVKPVSDAAVKIARDPGAVREALRAWNIP